MKLYNQNSRQLLLFLFSFFSCIICFSQGLEPRFGSTNGDVTEIISDGTYTYIGGKFTAVFDSSEEYGHGVVMDASTGTLEEGFPYVNRIIETIIPDGNGGWYIGGSFSQVGGITRSKLAHILADNTVDAMFNPGVIEGIVYSIELFGSDFLTIAGTFTSVNEQPRKRLARIHKETGALEDWAPSIDGGEVRGTVVDGDNLLVYGSFTNVDGGTSRGRMTKINSTTGEFGDFDPKFDQRVNKAIIEGDNIIAGGAFTSMYEGTIQRSRLVKMNKNTGVVSASWNPAPTSTVNDILLEDGFLYVSGFFSTIGGANADKFAKLDVATGVVDNTFDFNFKTSNGQPAVYDITSDGSGSLYIAGKFTEADNVPLGFLAKISTDGIVDDTFNTYLSSVATSIAHAGSDIFVGGDFSHAGGEARVGVAKIDIATGNLDPWNPQLNAAGTSALLVEGDSIYVSGTFTAVAGTTRNRAAKIHKVTGEVGDWDPNLGGSPINKFILEGDSLYFGGAFNRVKGETRNRLAKVHKITGGLSDWNPDANSSVIDMEILGDSIFVAGYFSIINTQTRNSFAKIYKFNKATGIIVSDWNPNADSNGNAIELDGDYVYVAGNFLFINGVSRQRLAKLHNTTAEVSPTWMANANSTINDLKVDGTNIFVAGGHTTINNIAGYGKLSLVNTQTGVLDINFDVNASGVVKTILINGNYLFVGGVFSALSSSMRKNFGGLKLEDDINVKQSSTQIASQDTFDFAEQQVGTSSGEVTFTIENNAMTTSTTLTGTPALVAVTGPNASDFIINETDIINPITAGGSTTFTVTFSPSDGGTRSAMLSIANNVGGSAENPYIIHLTGEAFKQDQTIDFTLPAAPFSCEENPNGAGINQMNLTATASSGLAVIYQSNNTDMATISGTVLTLVGTGGTVGITAIQEGDANYNAAVPVEQTLTVNADVTSPTAVAQDVTVTLDVNGNATVAPSAVDNNSTDDCTIGNISLELDQTEFTCDHLGSNTVTLTVIDAAGNTDTATTTITVNDQLRSIAQNITVSLDASGNATIVAADIDVGSSITCSGSGSLVLDITSFDCSDIGENTVTLTADDGAGNSETTTATVTVQDNTAPIVITQNIIVTLDASGNATITADDINNGSNDNCTAAGALTASLDNTNFDCSHVGDNTVTLTVTDALGNTASATASVNVQDNTAPIVIAQNIVITLDASGNAIITAADIDNGSNDNCTNAGALTASLDNTNFDCSHVGDNTVTLTVTDASGNTASTTATVTVREDTPPTAIAKDITVNLDASGNATITAADINNGSNDNCTTAGALEVSLDNTNFDCTEIGENAVTLTVTDASGNTASANATVIVQEDTPPTAIAKDISLTLDASGNATITADDINNGSNDNCTATETLTTGLDNTNFDCSHVGDNTVTLMVTDASGNTASANATVTVREDTPPTAIAKDITVNLDAGGNGTITAADIDNGSNDNCTATETLTTGLDNTAFDCSHVGENTVTLTVTDASGNTASATATITVNTTGSCITGIEEEIINPSNNVYPNPTTGEFILQMAFESPKYVSYQLLDQTGKVIVTKQLGTQSSVNERLTLKHLENGIYYLKVTINNKKTTTYKIVKR